MTLKILRTIVSAAAAIFLTAAIPASADGPTMLTVTGSIENTNRGGFDPGYDKLFDFNDISFDSAMEFDADAFSALPAVTIKTDFPKGGEIVEFSGHLLKDVLAAAGATGENITIQAMDGYSVEIPMAEVIEKGGMVALSRDGKPFGIGNFGPTQIVFPRSDREDLADMADDWWIWQIFHIVVE